MDTKEIVQKVLQEMVVPDLGKIRDENSKILAILDLTNKRLDDVNTQLADQSRRIDEIRSELSQRIDEVRSELSQQINETNKRMDGIHSDLINRLDANNARIDRFFMTIVTKTEHEKLERRLLKVERDVDMLQKRLAA